MGIVCGIGQCTFDNISFVDSYPIEDTKCEVSPWQTFGGGPVATALVCLARLGVKTRFMGVVSDDYAGKNIEQGLIEEGVDLKYMIRESGKSSQTAFIIVNKANGNRTIFWSKATVNPVLRGTFNPAFLDGAAMLHLDGFLPELAFDALDAAKKMGIPVMIDVGKPNPNRYELVKRCDYVVCSEEFGKAYGDSDHTRALARLIEHGARAATVTLGRDGSITLADGEIFRQPAYDIKAVDTTGAGDVFHGGYIYGLISGMSIRDTVRFASAAAAIKCLSLGGRAGIAGLEETLIFMKTHEL